MEYLKYVAVGLTALFSVAILFTAFISKKPFRMLFFNALSGIIALVVVNLLTDFTGINIEVNQYSVVGASVFSVPAVIGLLLLKIVVL